MTRVAIYPEMELQRNLPRRYPLPIHYSLHIKLSLSLPPHAHRTRNSHSSTFPLYTETYAHFSLPSFHYLILMALSRILSQSLPRPSTALIRHRSTKPNHAQLIEVDLEPSSPSQPDSAEVVSVGIRKLEEAIHNIIVRRAAPDWLPFRPGYSYWVPPRPSITRNHPAGGMIEAIEKFTSSDATRNSRFQHELLSEDEQMSLISAKGWPSSAFFIQGTSPQHPIPVMELVDTSSSKDDLG